MEAAVTSSWDGRNAMLGNVNFAVNLMSHAALLSM